MSEPVITVEHLSKRFRLFHERNQSLKAAVLSGRRARYEEFWALDDVSLDVQWPLPATATTGRDPQQNSNS